MRGKILVIILMSSALVTAIILWATADSENLAWAATGCTIAAGLLTLFILMKWEEQNENESNK